MQTAPAPGSFWDRLERDTTPKQRRANHAKVRSGCLTCKKRRVKCDEAKPSCARCEKGAYACEGYEEPGAVFRAKYTARQAKNARTSAAAPLPNRNQMHKPILPAPQRPGSLTGFRVAPVPFHLDPRDVTYFDRFRHQIVEDMSLWSTIPSRMNHLLREALHDDPHHKIALQHYMKAIALCRAQLTGGMTKNTALSSLGAALVFSCIELMQGDVAAADRLLSNGLKLLEDVKNKKVEEEKKALQFDDELAQMEYCFDRIAIGCGTSPFFRAQREMCKVVNVPPHEYIPDVDVEFSSLRLHWMRFQKGVALFMLGAYSNIVTQPGAEVQHMKEKARYLSLVEQWTPVVNAFLEREKDDQAIRLLMSMKVHMMIWGVYLRCGLDHFNVAYDSHVDTFREVVALVDEFFTQTCPTAYARFSLDVVLFSSMCFVISACRHKETRQRALSVFDKLTRQEACWGNVGMLRALHALADLEEQGRDEHGCIPLASRYAFVGCDWDFEHRRTMAKFVPVVKEPGGLEGLPVTLIPLDY
ncbi:putative c6 zinc finger domain-containing protein [Eutypa lata UCREL1]|uniref:Putative c6 zinc finger domain-containing protein n=1 Tax=Eutypa lata (strain UCR-EL1) TaxID=1287681 RepID=M7SHJ6_EUTLA|nr:putative c6 zinc finger domain-containing protein [Eutypa lata UCREL1]